MREEAAWKSWLAKFGVDRWVAPVFGGRGAILMFHRVCAPREDFAFDLNRRNMVSPEQLCRLIDALREEGTQIVDLDESLERLTTRRTGRFVCLTFDDGYLDNHDILLPIAENRKAPVTIYISPGLIDGVAPLWWYGLDLAISQSTKLTLPLPRETVMSAGTAEEKLQTFHACVGFMLEAAPAEAERLALALAERHGVDFRKLAAAEMLDWPRVRALAASPWVTIGAHTISHLPLSRLPENAVREEMGRSRDRLEREIGQPVVHFAYPYGSAHAVGRREIGLARESGFRTSVVSDGRNLFSSDAANVHAWPRHGVGPDDTPATVRLKMAGLTRATMIPARRR